MSKIIYRTISEHIAHTKAKCLDEIKIILDHQGDYSSAESVINDIQGLLEESQIKLDALRAKIKTTVGERK